MSVKGGETVRVGVFDEFDRTVVLMADYATREVPRIPIRTFYAENSLPGNEVELPTDDPRVIALSGLHKRAEQLQAA